MTQRETVLQALKDAGDTGIHSFDFLQVGIPRAAARIRELREMGYTISSVRERLNGEAEGVRYRLVEQAQTVLVPESVDELADRLFPLPSKPHWTRDAA